MIRSVCQFCSSSGSSPGSSSSFWQTDRCQFDGGLTSFVSIFYYIRGSYMM